MSQSLEKIDIEVRFIPILCATPLLYAQRYGLFEANGRREGAGARGSDACFTA